MKIVIDMNLSPQWVDVLQSEGHVCVHWSKIGSINASDQEILVWARLNEYVVLTHDLDFGAILAATDADSPSVLQIRAQDVSPQYKHDLIISAFEQFEDLLTQGALVSIDETKSKARILPIKNHS